MRKEESNIAYQEEMQEIIKGVYKEAEGEFEANEQKEHEKSSAWYNLENNVAHYYQARESLRGFSQSQNNLSKR